MRKASVGMYIVDVIRYPYKSCWCIFWHCHPYFIPQFYSIVFYTCILYVHFVVLIELPYGQIRFHRG